MSRIAQPTPARGNKEKPKQRPQKPAEKPRKTSPAFSDWGYIQ